TFRRLRRLNERWTGSVPKEATSCPRTPPAPHDTPSAAATDTGATARRFATSTPARSTGERDSAGAGSPRAEPRPPPPPPCSPRNPPFSPKSSANASPAGTTTRDPGSGGFSSSELKVGPGESPAGDRRGNDRPEQNR